MPSFPTSPPNSIVDRLKWIEFVSNHEPHPEEKEPPDTGESLENSKNYYLNKKLSLELTETKDTHSLRMSFSWGIFWLVLGWLICVVITVFLAGWNIWGFTLSDKVLITFITSTTINVIGLFGIVAKWMFPSNSLNNAK